MTFRFETTDPIEGAPFTGGIPIHPQPGIFESIVLRIPTGKAKPRTAPYNHNDYASQRNRRFANVPELRTRATTAMRRAGWAPDEFHPDILVAPARTKASVDA